MGKRSSRCFSCTQNCQSTAVCTDRNCFGWDWQSVHACCHALASDRLDLLQRLQEVQRLLKATSAKRLPRCGGKVAEVFSSVGVHTIADLQVTLAEYLKPHHVIWTLPLCPLVAGCRIKNSVLLGSSEA